MNKLINDFEGGVIIFNPLKFYLSQNWSQSFEIKFGFTRGKSNIYLFSKICCSQIRLRFEHYNNAITLFLKIFKKFFLLVRYIKIET